MGVLSKGIKLSYKASGSTYTELANLQEIPEIGGEAESVEITTLDDAAHTYMNGILSYGDSLDFTFLHDKTQFATMVAWTDEMEWKLVFPDGASGAAGTTVTWKGYPSVKIASVGVNDAMTDTLSIKPSSAFTFA